MHEVFWIEPGKLAGGRYPSTRDLRMLYKQGFRIIVALEIRDDINELESIGYVVHPFEIEDFTAPTIPQIEAFNTIVEQAGDTPILVHCKGGYGRTGTMLAAHLIKHRGLSPEDAIRFVRERRPGAIEGEDQIEILFEYEMSLKGANP